MFMRSKILKSKLTLFVIIFLIFISVMITYSMLSKPESFSTKVLLVTSMGNITIGLYDDMPITTANFLNLTQRGIYDGTIFHRVVENFVVQGGDPTGTGLGDPNIASIPDELPNRHSNVAGTVAMANKGPNTGSSQFFINLVDNSASLDSKHPVFGKVTEGMDVVEAIGKVRVDADERPLQEVKLIKAILL